MKEILFKKDHNNKVVIWEISTYPDMGMSAPYYIIRNGSFESIFKGKIKGKKYEVRKGANIGKANQTNAWQQCEVIAKNKIKGKRRLEGLKSVFDLYNTTENIVRVQKLIEDFYNKVSYIELERELEKVLDDDSASSPMKAHTHIDLKTNRVVMPIPFPCFAQPKLNGLRLTAGFEIVEKGEGLFKYKEKCAVIKSKNGLEYVGLAHITAELSKIFSKIRTDQDGYLFGYNSINNRTLLISNLVFDGEAYKHGWQLERILSLCTKEAKESKEIRFHTVDLAIKDIDQTVRLRLLAEILNGHYTINYENQPIKHLIHYGDVPIVRVVSLLIRDKKEADDYFEEVISLGFEGAMYRATRNIYKFGMRSKSMIKRKKAIEEEVIISDIVQCSFDNYMTKDYKILPIGLYECHYNDQILIVTPAMDKENRALLLINKHKYIGRKLTIRYYEFSNTGLPKHCTGIIRDYE